MINIRLNIDCIRDILLYIESNTNFEKSLLDVDTLVNSLKNYDADTLYYHIKMISQANLVDKVSFADSRPFFISSLSWEGHEYLDNIRDTKIWTMLKDKTNKLSSISLKVLISLAPKLIEQYLLNS